MDFSRMKYKVHDVPTNKQVLKELPELAKIYKPLMEQLSEYESTTPDQLMRYIAYAYDRRSPFAQEADVVKRKIEAMHQAGVMVTKEDKQHPAWSVIFLQDKVANNFKMQYVKYQDSHAWRQLMIKMDALDNVERAITGDNVSKGKTPVEIAKVVAEVNDKMKSLERDILELTDKLFGGDEDMIDHVASFIEDSKNWIITPEDYALHGSSL